MLKTIEISTLYQECLFILDVYIVNYLTFIILSKINQCISMLKENYPHTDPLITYLDEGKVRTIFGAFTLFVNCLTEGNLR